MKRLLPLSVGFYGSDLENAHLPLKVQDIALKTSTDEIWTEFYKDKGKEGV